MKRVTNVSIAVMALVALFLQGCPKKQPEEPQPRVYELPVDTGIGDLPESEDAPDSE